jgi:hypothetical protein
MAERTQRGDLLVHHREQLALVEALDLLECRAVTDVRERVSILEAGLREIFGSRLQSLVAYGLHAAAPSSGVGWLKPTARSPVSLLDGLTIGFEFFGVAACHLIGISCAPALLERDHGQVAARFVRAVGTRQTPRSKNISGMQLN